MLVSGKGASGSTVVVGSKEEGIRTNCGCRFERGRNSDKLRLSVRKRKEFGHHCKQHKRFIASMLSGVVFVCISSCGSTLLLTTSRAVEASLVKVTRLFESVKPEIEPK